MNNVSDLDFSALDRLELKLPAVGVKFEYFRPESIPQLEQDVHMSLCEMLRECQRRNKPFYFSRDNDETCIGKVLLGMQQFPGTSEAGLIGQRLGVFQDPRGNRNLYNYIPKLAADSVNYVAFAPYDQLTFRPDELVIACNHEQGERVMRALTYATGCLYEAKFSVVMGCAWFIIQPFKTGKPNFVIPSFVHGPHGRELYDHDTILITIPYQWIPTFLMSLQEMPLKLTGQTGVQAYHEEFEGIIADLSVELQKEMESHDNP